MRDLPAFIIVVAAMAAPLAGLGCYSVPSLQSADGGPETANGDASNGDRTGPGPDSSSSSGGSSGSSSGSSSSGGGSSSGSSGGGGSSGSSGSSSGSATCTGRGVLCPCNNASDCASNVCATVATLGSALLGAAGNSFCTQPCCTSTPDCPAGTVCYASGMGGQYCVDPAWLGRSKPASGQTLPGGSTCSTGSQCASGLCSGGTCADTCCSFTSSSSECASPGASCVFGLFPGKQGIDTHFAPQCGTAPGSTGYANPCSANTDCQGGLCSGGFCTMPCRSQQECGSGAGCQQDVQGSDMYVACFVLPTNQTGNGDIGAACSGGDLDCLSDYCDTTNAVNECTGPCFTDADCTAHVSTWRCTPNLDLTPPAPAQGTYYGLGCGP